MGLGLGLGFGFGFGFWFWFGFEQPGLAKKNNRLKRPLRLIQTRSLTTRSSTTKTRARSQRHHLTLMAKKLS